MEKENFEFIGGSLCLDLANTIGGARNRASETDHLTSYADLLHWTHEAGLISEMERQHLEAKAQSDSPGASSVLARVKALREAIYRIFSNISARDGVLDTELLLLNEEIERSFQRSRIVRTSEGYAWGWAKELTLDCMIAPVVRSAADLLTTSSALDRIRECASDNCSWLFLDETKNRSRRWCNMKTCGNAHKVNRYRARQTGNLNEL
ncbi:ABATE domain-containing protein [Paenibacillus sp. XY044]|uniref:CGNR zinc finger domain-containing protein n=1 Tax=Paenibacillus sp. XY044 TaxID=2026089 RepID=UPI000B99875C|nr:ABATE domain-containing protein [Paenibacillus sp. XY044]OZB90123.1 hypothetical protein CJP46_35155 [Paenibacillus sp. XY044]